VARVAVCAYYAEHRAQVSPDHIVLTTSTSEAYSFLFRLLCDPGSEILALHPGYPLFDFLAVLDDVHLRQARLSTTTAGRSIPKVFGAPSPPHASHHARPSQQSTGHFIKAWEAAELARLCREHNLALVVDEVFLDYGLGNASSLHSLRTFAQGVDGVTVFVVSDSARLPAFRR